MSHFVIMVKVSPKILADHDSDVNEAITHLLAPYQEYDGGEPEEFIKFNSNESEYQIKYQTDKIAVLNNLPLVDTKEYKQAQDVIRKEDPDRYPTDTDIVARLKKDGHKIINRKLNKFFETFDQYMEHLGEEKDEKTGKYGYWSNPNSKWDWWVIGGRWQGMLRTTNGKDVDVAKIKDIDWDYYKKKAVEDANARYDGMKEYWEIHAKHGGDRSKIEPELATLGKDVFHSYNINTAAERLGLITKNGKLVPLPSKADFVKSFISYDEFGTYAVIEKNGKWLAKGDMGWFGCSSETPEEAKKWDDSFFDNFIAKEDPETTLVMVDCHI